jgi:hypothetical protein
MHRARWRKLLATGIAGLAFSLGTAGAQADGEATGAAAVIHTDREPAPPPTQDDPCVCGLPWCLGLCHFDPERGVFALGRPWQFVPPPSGWTVMLVPNPPKPKPGQKPPPPSPFKPLFYDNDFTYLTKPGNPYHDPFDFLKRLSVPAADWVVHDFGGEFRWQGRGEDNRRLTGEQNNFNLFRERLFLNTRYGDRFRTSFEVIWADASRQTVPPVFFDLDHGDFLNAFGELKVLETDDGAWSGRFGWKQELLFGNQRLVSPLDWANMRRTFNTVANALYRGKNWSFDAFWGRPNVILARQLDQPNYGQQFFGTYLTYKGLEGQLLDGYYLGLLQDADATTSLNGESGAFGVHTVGTRWQHDREDWLAEIETAYQFGRAQGLPRNAGMATAGIGRRFADLWGKPELMFYYDYASGTQDPSGGSYATFNQLFPLGHKYFGYMDIVGRQNILDPNVFLKFYPSKRVNFLLWYHHFNLASARDALYNAAGNPIRRDPTGAAGTYVGDELDFVINLIVNPHCDFQIGASHFWSGPFIQRTAPDPQSAEDGNFFYTQFLFRF